MEGKRGPLAGLVPLLPHAQHGPGQASRSSSVSASPTSGPYHAQALPGALVSSVPPWASASPEASKWTLTAAAKVVDLVQPKEAVLASCAGQATHVGLAEALAVALGAEGEGGSRGWGGSPVYLPTAPSTPACRLTSWHSATPPSVPLGSQLQRVQPSGLLGLSPQNPGLQRSQLGPSTWARHVQEACAWERMKLSVRVGPCPPIH